MSKPDADKFSSPSDLREFALETAAQLRATGLSEAGEIMEAAATFVSGSGWEWLGELEAAGKTIHKQHQLPDSIAARVSRIRATATSRHPYRC